MSSVLPKFCRFFVFIYILYGTKNRTLTYEHSISINILLAINNYIIPIFLYKEGSITITNIISITPTIIPIIAIHLLFFSFSGLNFTNPNIPVTNAAIPHGIPATNNHNY